MNLTVERKYKDVKDLLQQGYQQANWLNLVRQLFQSRRAKLFENPLPIAIADTDIDKVRTLTQLGRIELDDFRGIALLEFQLTENKIVSRNRVELRNLAARLIDNDRIHAVLAIFYVPGQPDYRLSLVAKSAEFNEEGELISVQTQPKRYTYVLGPHEACTTATTQLLTIQAKAEYTVRLVDVVDAFSVEKLNREFFKTYKEFYERFWKYLAATPEYRTLLITEALPETSTKEQLTKAEKPLRDFAKKLLGRIVFLHFLQRKGWMGCPANRTDWTGGDPNFMKKLYEEYAHPEHFYSQCLTILFFETLNQNEDQRPSHVFAITNSRVPYLNGGLFEEEDRAHRTIDFPAEFFRELFIFFEQYNFTIDENSPDDQEVGIDPEMLGHIFENLLEENREKGTFYTPKEIVQYMCQESLIQYLYQKLAAVIEDNEDRQELAYFVRTGERPEKLQFVKRYATQIEKHLDKIRICDPAVGSGAFPMGMLQEILKAKLALDLTLNDERADVKKHIIQHSIYGVDIEKGAVDIARLRFWLALIVDEDEPLPLPNLDYKIMQGNSLLESYDGIDLSKAGSLKPYQVNSQPYLFDDMAEENSFSEEEIQTISKLTKAYFAEEDKAEKQRLHKEIDSKVIEHIDKALERHENGLHSDIARLKKELQANLKSLRTASQQHAYLQKSKETKQIQQKETELVKKEESRKQLLMFEEKGERPYFLWHLYFKDVMDEGGFDVIIGNPPYVQLQSMREEAAPYKEYYRTFTATGDLYCLFYELGNNLLKPHGNLTFITGNSWLRSNYGKQLRQYFLDYTAPIQLIDLSDSPVFESATVRTSIFQFKNDTQTSLALQAMRITRKDQHNLKELNKLFETMHSVLTTLTDKAWTIDNAAKQVIKKTVQDAGKKLKEWEIEIYRGVLTGFNEAFVIDEEVKNSLIEQAPESAELLKPLLRGRDLGRYHFYNPSLWLIGTFPSLNLDISTYGAIEAHLSTFGKERLEQSGNSGARKKTGNEWFETQDQIGYWQNFEKPKIIYPNMVKDISFAYDESGFYTNQKCFIITGEKLKYLVGVLNARLFRYCFEEEFPELEGNAREINKVVFEEIPIKVPDEPAERMIGILVDYLTYLHGEALPLQPNLANNQHFAQFFDEVLNGCVYELYFSDHMHERQITILDLVQQQVPSIEGLEEEERRTVIYRTYQILRQPDNEIRNRMQLFVSRSPEILQPIIQS